jgi:signal transduction histidine kinase
MGLRKRIILVVTLPALLATAVHGVFRVQQERAQLLAEEQENLALTGKAVRIAVENALRDYQLSDVGRLVLDMVDREQSIDQVRFFNRDLAPVIVSHPLKVGEAIPADALRRVMQSGASEVFAEQRGRLPVITAIVPVHGRSGEVDGAMEIVRIGAAVDRRTRAAITDVFVRLAVLLAATVLLTALSLQRQVLWPLAELARGIQRLGEGHASGPLPVDRSDEIGKVARQFKEMGERLQEAHRQREAETERALLLEQQARQAAALAVAGKLAVAFAHEVGTPLNIISARAEFILRALAPDDPRREDIAAIVGQIDRISRIITTVLDVVRPQAPKLELIEIEPILQELLPLLRIAARPRGVTLQSSVEDRLPPVRGDAAQLQQVLINLVVNALDATPPHGTVTVSARAQPRGDRPGVALSVSDTGSGIEPELQAKIFESFFTTKPRGQGTGLGLAIARDIVRGHAGDVFLESAPHVGSTFTIWLPAAEPSRDGVRPTTAPARSNDA